MTVVDYTLRSPCKREEWIAFHAIRRKVLFENRGEVGVYRENHPDDFELGHYPLVLVHKEATIGVIRVDVTGQVAFARDNGCNEVRSNVAADAVRFYERCGYTRHVAIERSESVPMRKSLA
jgi:hypothetical protein